MPVTVRAVQRGEHARVGELTVEAYRTLPGPAHIDDAYEADIRDVAGRLDSTVVLVAVDELDRVIGSATYVPDARSPWAETLRDGEAGLRLLAVDPLSQNRGVGRALLRSVIERACTDDRAALVLHTTPWMRAAGRLYEQVGFVRAPERDFAVDGLELIAYLLDLSEGGRHG